MANVLVINAAELLRRPGNERDLELDLTPAELDLADARLDHDGPIGVRLHLESLSDGIVVTGTIAAPWSATCRRCLAAAGGTATSDVHELYQHVVTDPDAFELVGEQLDLRPMIRELVLLELPEAALCRDDCAGLCPRCGADRNLVDCGCTEASPDPRWDALSGLRAQLDERT